MHDSETDPQPEDDALTKRLPRVLLVDDERGIRMALRRILTQGGLEVVAAASGEEAVRAVEQGPRFDIILTDLRMPGMQGLEFMRVVRGLDSEVPIVVLTGDRDAQATARLLEAGASTCLDKPVEGDLLLDTLRGLVTRPALDDSRAALLDDRLHPQVDQANPRG